ncbi:MAG: type II secretion system F family protein, partial [Planctomycetota bacterium]
CSTRCPYSQDSAEYYSEMKDEISESLQAGTQMSEAYRSAEIFPDEFLTKLAVAEMSGSDAEGLVYIAQDYQQRAKSAIRTISGIFTAIIWLTIAGVFIYMIYCMAMEVFFKPIAEALKPI